MPSVRVSLAVALTVVFGAAWQAKGANLTLLDAIRANDGERVRTLLAERSRPQHDGFQSGVRADVRSALRRSACARPAGGRGSRSQFAGTRTGLTALAWAVHSYESAKVLIDAGADVNAKSNIGGTPSPNGRGLSRKCGAAPVDARKREPISKTSVFGSTALTMAALTGDADDVALLLENGADPNPPGPGGTFGPPSGGDAGRSPDGEVAPRCRGEIRSAYLTGRGYSGTLRLLERPGCWSRCFWNGESTRRERTSAATTPCFSRPRRTRSRRKFSRCC